VTDLIVDSYLRLSTLAQVRSLRPFRPEAASAGAPRHSTGAALFRPPPSRLYLTSYSTYIEHGIAVRVALQEGTKVVSSAACAVRQAADLTDWVHTPNADSYRRAFASLDDKPRAFARPPPAGVQAVGRHRFRR
jgi:hypothetical protein